MTYDLSWSLTPFMLTYGVPIMGQAYRGVYRPVIWVFCPQVAQPSSGILTHNSTPRENVMPDLGGT